MHKAAAEEEVAVDQDKDDLELLSERLRNLQSSSRVSPRRTTAKPRLNHLSSDSTQHHPLLPSAEPSTPFVDGSQFSGSPVLSEEENDDEDEDDDDEEILATLSPPSELAGKTSPFPAPCVNQEDGQMPEDQMLGAVVVDGSSSSLAEQQEATSGRRDTSAESLALTLLGTAASVEEQEEGKQDSHAPKVCDLKWLVGDWDNPPPKVRKGFKRKSSGFD